MTLTMDALRMSRCNFDERVMLRQRRAGNPAHHVWRSIASHPEIQFTLERAMNILTLLKGSLTQTRRYSIVTLVFFVLAGGAVTAIAQSLDLTSPDLWKPEKPPFSFNYDGKASSTFLNKWQVSQETPATANGEIYRYIYRDPVTHLEVIAEIRLYPDFPGAIDWVLRFRNEGSSDTPIIENILPLNWSMAASADNCILHHAQGSDAAADDFRPLENRLDNGFTPWEKCTWNLRAEIPLT